MFFFTPKDARRIAIKIKSTKKLIERHRRVARSKIRLESRTINGKVFQVKKCPTVVGILEFK